MTENVTQIAIPRGATKLFVVIGDPINQVQAPLLMNRLFVGRSADAIMVPLHVRAEDLDQVVEGLKRITNLGGILVTVPHKFAVCRHVDRMSPRAELAQSANAVRRGDDGRWEAENFDGIGFVKGLEKAGHDPKSKVVALIGAGGAGVAIAPALLAAGAKRIVVTDIAPHRAEALAQRLNARWPNAIQAAPKIDLGEIDIAVNATPIGLKDDDPLPFDPALLPDGALVADIIMKPAETRLLKTAARKGLSTHHGIHMLHEQIDFYRQFFHIGVTDAGADEKQFKKVAPP